MKHLLTTLLLVATIAGSSQAQTVFEGRLTYRSVSDLSQSEYYEYHKGNKVLTDRPSEGIKMVYDHTNGTFMTGKSAYGERLAEINATVLAEPVEVDGHKCIELHYDTVSHGTEISTVEWVDTTYDIIFHSGQIKSVTHGLLVRSRHTFRLPGLPTMTTTTRLVKMEEQILSEKLFDL